MLVHQRVWFFMDLLAINPDINPYITDKPDMKSSYKSRFVGYKSHIFYSPNNKITRSGGLFSGDPTKR